jgi:hypothetical protein
LLVGTMAVATDALAAGHGGGGGGGFGGGHMGGGFRGPLLESVPSMPPPVFNPSSPYTVPASPETPVSPGSPGSIFLPATQCAKGSFVSFATAFCAHCFASCSELSGSSLQRFW